MGRPRQTVERVGRQLGVNFEDEGLQGDRDYNDAVLCFKGHFNVDGTNVVSFLEQDVVGTTSSISGCNHTIQVQIINNDGTSEPLIQYDSKSTTPVNMHFKVGSRLEVALLRDARRDGRRVSAWCG